MNKNISFNDVPEILGTILTKLGELSEKVDNIHIDATQEKHSTWLTVASLIEYLPSHPAEQTVYGWTSARKIPFHKKGKNILFLKSEIDDWLQQGETFKSVGEIEREAFSFLGKKKGGLR